MLCRFVMSQAPLSHRKNANAAPAAISAASMLINPASFGSQVNGFGWSLTAPAVEAEGLASLLLVEAPG